MNHEKLHVTAELHSLIKPGLVRAVRVRPLG